MMLKNKDKLIKQVIDGFQLNKGKANTYCYNKELIPELVYNIIKPFYNKNPNRQIFIVVDSYNTRKSILDYIKENNTDNCQFNIKVLSVDYIKQQYHYNYDLIIIVGVNDNFPIINKLNTESKFTLCILTENKMNNDFTTSIRKILHYIDTANLDASIKQDNIYSPVEEHRYGVDLSDSDKELYNKYTDYINTCVAIFGDLSNIEKCKKGDATLNISSTEFCNNLAKENGWNTELDTNIPFMKQIDEIYNPNALFEKACNFYNIVRQRRDLVTDNVCKLQIILNICLENKDKRILIVSKRGEFAAQVTKYINNNTTEIKCGDYHDCIEDAIATDDYGNVILVKSGVDKGKPKVIGSQAQSSLNERRFNCRNINVLSIKSASNPKLKTACDLVIFSSSLCDNIIDLKKRFTNVKFDNVLTKTYRVYCNNTIEYNSIIKEKESNLIQVINETENFIDYDENSGDVIL